MTSSQLDFVHSIIAEQLGLKGNKVVWANQNMPKLSKPFATLQVFGIRHEVSEELRQTATAGTVNVVVPTTATVSVQYYGTDACSKLEDLVRSFDKPTIVDRCANVCVAFYDAESILDLSALLDNQTWEERASIDLHIRYNHEAEDTPGYIDTVTITGNTDPATPDPEFTVSSKD